MKMLALVVLAGGCSLYSGDDAPIDPGVDAGASVDAVELEPMSGNYTARLMCQGGNCGVSPLADEPFVSIGEQPGEVRVSWSHLGATVPAAIHVGQRSANGCAQFPGGMDKGVAREPYALCFDTDGVAGLMTWGSSTWRADLVR